MDARRAAVLRTFLADDGSLTQMPAKAGKRRIVLEHDLAEEQVAVCQAKIVGRCPDLDELDISTVPLFDMRARQGDVTRGDIHRDNTLECFGEK